VRHVITALGAAAYVGEVWYHFAAAVAHWREARWQRACRSPCKPFSSGLPLFDHLLVDHLDISPDTIPIPPQGVFGHALFVFGRQVVRQLLFASLPGWLPPPRLASPPQSSQLNIPEERQMGFRHYLPMARDNMREIELFEGLQGLHPVFWVAIVEEGHPVDQRIPSRHHLFLR